LENLPKNVPDFLIQQFLSHTKDLLEKRANIKTTTIPNPTDVGGHLEGMISQLFKSYLPGKYGVNSGYILNKDLDVTKQQDLIIYDWIEGTNFSATEQYSVFPVESVYAAVEVKSTLSHKTLEDSSSNAKTVKQLRGVKFLIDRKTRDIVNAIEYGQPVYTALVAFEADISLETLAAKAIHYLDHICVIGKGNVIWCTKEKEVDSEGSLSIRSGPFKEGEFDNITVLEPKGPEHYGLPLFILLSEIGAYSNKKSDGKQGYELMEYVKWPMEGMMFSTYNKPTT
jgi:hypothetical protein